MYTHYIYICSRKQNNCILCGVRRALSSHTHTRGVLCKKGSTGCMCERDKMWGCEIRCGKNNRMKSQDACWCWPVLWTGAAVLGPNLCSLPPWNHRLACGGGGSHSFVHCPEGLKSRHPLLLRYKPMLCLKGGWPKSWPLAHLLNTFSAASIPGHSRGLRHATMPGKVQLSEKEAREEGRKERLWLSMWQETITCTALPVPTPVTKETTVLTTTKGDDGIEDGKFLIVPIISSTTTKNTLDFVPYVIWSFFFSPPCFQNNTNLQSSTAFGRAEKWYTESKTRQSG